MTGLECLREEMRMRGATPAMVDSKAAAMVLDIVANTPDAIYEKTDEAEQKLATLSRKIETKKAMLDKVASEYNEAQGQLISLKCEIAAGKSQLSNRKQQEIADARKYIDEFNESLKGCETPEARDQMRTVQLFMDATEVNTKYDNTAFIIGLAAILSRGKVAAISTLKKINDKIAEPSDLPAWLENEPGWSD